MYAATHTAAHAQAYTTLVKNCSSKLDITWHTITYLITEAYFDKLHTVFLVLNSTCTGHAWYVQFTARVAHSFCQQHWQSNHGCVVP